MPGNDAFEALLRTQSLINSSGGGNGGGAVCAVLKDANVGTGVSLQGGGLKFDASFRAASQGRPGMIANLIKAMGLDGAAILEGLKKCGQEGAVREASITDITGSHNSFGGGGGFVQSLNMGGGSGGMEVG